MSSRSSAGSPAPCTPCTPCTMQDSESPRVYNYPMRTSALMQAPPCTHTFSSSAASAVSSRRSTSLAQARPGSISSTCQARGWVGGVRWELTAGTEATGPQACALIHPPPSPLPARPTSSQCRGQSISRASTTTSSSESAWPGVKRRGRGVREGAKWNQEGHTVREVTHLQGQEGGRGGSHLIRHGAHVCKLGERAQLEGCCLARPRPVAVDAVARSQ